MWQYKTILEARIPRYHDGEEVRSVAVPWALPNSRMSWLMEKTIETLLSAKNQTKTARLLRLTFEQVHGVMLRAVERGLDKRDKTHIYKHVCMDEKSIRHCHDLYHCVTYLNDAVDKVRKREVKEFKELRSTKYLWLKDKSKYTPNDHRRFDMLENAEYQVSQAWKVKELFRNLLRLNYHGDMEAYGMLGDWMADALQYNIEEINGVVFMFKRHLKGIIRAMVTGANNGKAERTNGSIQEIRTIGRGYGTAERYRIAILFFYGGLDIC